MRSNNGKLIDNYYYTSEVKIKSNVKINLNNIVKIKEYAIFRRIDDLFEDKFSNYCISNYGRIYNNKKNIIMKTLKT